MSKDTNGSEWNAARYAGIAPRAQPDEKPEEDVEQIVGIGRIGTRPQITVKFCPHDAPAQRFDYGHYYRTVELERNAVLVLEFSEQLVRIEGEGLDALDRWLGDRKVRLVEAKPEAGRAASFGVGADGQPRVHRIEIADKPKHGE